MWLLRHSKGCVEEDSDLFKAVVVSPDGLIQLPWRVVVPVIHCTHKSSLRSWVVPLEVSARNGRQVREAADALLVRGVRLERFVRRVGVLDAPIMEELTAAMALCFGCYDPGWPF